MPSKARLARLGTRLTSKAKRGGPFVRYYQPDDTPLGPWRDGTHEQPDGWLPPEGSLTIQVRYTLEPMVGVGKALGHLPPAAEVLADAAPAAVPIVDADSGEEDELVPVVRLPVREQRMPDLPEDDKPRHPNRPPTHEEMLEMRYKRVEPRPAPAGIEAPDWLVGLEED